MCSLPPCDVWYYTSPATVEPSGRWGRNPRSGDESFPNGVENDLGRIVQIQLLHEIGPMRFDRRHAQIEQRRHFLVRSSLGEEVEDLSFPVGQQVIRVAQATFLQRAQVILDEHGGNGRAEERLPGADSADRR